MKDTSPRSDPPVCSAESQTDTTKLVSLLALAAGAVVMPQSGRADIVYTDLRSSPAQVGFSGGSDSFLFNLPGTARFGLQPFQRSCPPPPYGGCSGWLLLPPYRGVAAGGYAAMMQAKAIGPGTGGGLAVPQQLGAAWDQGLLLFSGVLIGAANAQAGYPVNGYDHQYLAWQFKDTTQVGEPLRYGWAEVSLNPSLFNIPDGGPKVTIYGYAYDDAGVKPTMGQVPEPSSIALMVLGALTLGARGLRSWRRNRQPL